MRFQTLWESRVFFALLGLLSLAGFHLQWPVMWALSLMGILFCLNFFPDPDRPGQRVKGDETIIARFPQL